MTEYLITVDYDKIFQVYREEVKSCEKHLSGMPWYERHHSKHQGIIEGMDEIMDIITAGHLQRCVDAQIAVDIEEERIIEEWDQLVDDCGCGETIRVRPYEGITEVI